jgi:hypothetical protein
MLFRPDNFRADPYGHTTNQTSHSMVGFLGFVYGFVLLVYLTWGEFPPKWAIIVCAAVAYTAFELWDQGWNGWDTVEDWIFVVVHGVAAPVMIFDEVTPGSPKFQGDLLVAAPFIVFFLCHLALGAWLRKRRADADQRQG